MAIFIFDLWTNICRNIVRFRVIHKKLFIWSRAGKKCYLGNDKSDKVKLVLKSSRMINIMIIYAIKMLYKLKFLNYSTKMATPISIYGQRSISETVNVRGLNVCLKEAERPCLYSTCEATYMLKYRSFSGYSQKNVFLCANKNAISKITKAIK